MTPRLHALGVALVALAAAPVLRTTAAQEGVRLNFPNADIRDVIRSLAAVLGVNVLLSEDVPARRVSYTTPAPVPVGELGSVLEAILESQGLVLIQRGPVAQVLPADRAPATGPVFFGKELPSPAPIGLITQIVPLEFIRPEEAIDALKQLASPRARMDVVPRSNSLLITDHRTNVARYLELLRQLDAKTQGEAGLRTYVYRLRHASAAELALTLSQLFGAVTPTVFPRARVEALGDRSLSRTLQGFRDRELQGLEMRRQTPIPSLTARGAALQDTAVAGAAGLVGQTTIVPDQATNSLVIRTAPPNYPVLRETIDSLDVRPPQVLLEVIIAEVSLDKSTQFGVNWEAVFGTDIAGAPTDATIRFGPQQYSDSALAGLQDFVVRVVRVGGWDGRAVLRALASQANVQVLSTPHILAMNNEEARILVGSEVPFSQSTRTGLDVVVDRIVQFRDVGTQLTIIPTINQDGYVTFRMLQEVSALTSQTVAAALGAPIITTREAETSALVRNGQTVVIGGLIDESDEVTESGVPFLKDIPLLGYLFKSRTTRKVRTELAIFVTPYVVYSDEEAGRLLERERERLKEAPPAPPAVRPPPEP